MSRVPTKSSSSLPAASPLAPHPLTPNLGSATQARSVTADAHSASPAGVPAKSTRSLPADEISRPKISPLDPTGGRARTHEAPAVQQLGAAVLLQGPALLDVRYLLALGVRVVQSRDGITPHGRLLHLQRVVEVAADEYRQNLALPAALDPGDVREDRCTTREAALTLGLSVRQVRRLAPQLGGVRHGRELLLERTAVEAQLAQRAEVGQ